MNPINKAVMNLKDDARFAGHQAAQENGEHSQNRALNEAYGKNVKAAHDGAQKFGWSALGMAQLLNDQTNKAFEKASGRKLEGWDEEEED